MRPEIESERRIQRDVLIVDDNEDLARSLACLLEFHGCRVEIAFDGPEGVRSALRKSFDVILIDIGLPMMSGYDVAAAIRDRCADFPVLLAQTAYNQPEDVRRSFEAGFDGHLVKPVPPEEILRYIIGGRAGLAKRPRGWEFGSRPGGSFAPRVAPAAS